MVRETSTAGGVAGSKRLASGLSRLAVAMAVAGVWCVAPAPFVLAQEAAVTSAAVSPIDPAVKKGADDFWHFVSVARYDLAAGAAKGLESADPVMVLRAFDAVASDRKQDLDRTIARWDGIEAVKEPLAGLKAILDKGRLALRADPAFIDENIKRLVVNERAYQLAVARLRQSGELAVPMMISYLRSGEQSQYHGAIRRALTDMGKYALNPLLASTEMKDSRVLATVATILGDMGYDTAVPYLLKLSASPDVGSSVRTAAASALGKLGASANLAPADAFYELGERFYYEKSLITADLSQAPNAYVWYWSESAGLTKLEVAPAIFNEIMAMRSAEQTLSLDQGNDKAVSLWLAANYRRETQIPAGGSDPTRAEGQPNADFYGLASGARYLNDALGRTLRDREPAVALKVVKSLQGVIGQQSVFSGAGGGASLGEALAFPDRVVRFEAAYAIASAMPAQAFPGSDQVVPVLSEMIAQTGKAGVVVIGANEEESNKLVEAVKALGYDAVGATSAEGAVSASAKLASTDAIVVSEAVALGVVDQLIAATGPSPKLARTPKVIGVKTGQSPFASRAAVDVLVNTTTATEPAAWKDAIEKARVRGGANPLDEAAATEGALRSLKLIEKLAVAKVPSLDLLGARPTVISALDDARPEVVTAAGQTLAVMGQREGQVAVATKATADTTPDALKISLLKSLAVSAKTFGNQLPSDAIPALEKLVTGAESLEVRNAAAEARGALNLPPQQAKDLILKQKRM